MRTKHRCITDNQLFIHKLTDFEEGSFAQLQEGDKTLKYELTA